MNLPIPATNLIYKQQFCIIYSTNSHHYHQRIDVHCWTSPLTYNAMGAFATTLGRRITCCAAYLLHSLTACLHTRNRWKKTSWGNRLGFLLGSKIRRQGVPSRRTEPFLHAVSFAIGHIGHFQRNHTLLNADLCFFYMVKSSYVVHHNILEKYEQAKFPSRPFNPRADAYSNKLATLLGFIARFHLTPSRYFSLRVISVPSPVQLRINSRCKWNFIALIYDWICLGCEYFKIGKSKNHSMIII